MSYNNFFVPDSGYSATPTEDLDNALRESGIPMSDLANALATRPQRRGPAPAPAGGVTKARQTAPGGRNPRQRVDANGQPLKRIAKACLNCRRTKMKCGGEQPSCGRCSGKRQLCRYGNTETEDAAQRADAENERRRQEAYAMVASAPQHCYLQPHSEGPFTTLGELAAVPVLSSPPSGQINQTQIDPVQSSADLSQYIPSLYTATQNTPPLSTSALYTPNQLTPNHFGETLGNWNPRPPEASQYPQGAGLMSDGLGDWRDEASQYPQQYQLARTNYTQPQYGQLPYNTQPQYPQMPYITQPPYGQPPYNTELDFAGGSSSDQIGGIPHYSIASNTVYDGAATWQDTYLLNQHQAEMGSMSFGLPAGNSYNA